MLDPGLFRSVEFAPQPDGSLRIAFELAPPREGAGGMMVSVSRREDGELGFEVRMDPAERKA